MLKTFGIFIYSSNLKKILVCHATNARWTQWSIPKGLSHSGEDSFRAACRELLEETAIDISLLSDCRVFPLPDVKYAKQEKVLTSFLVITAESFSEYRFKSNLADQKSFPEVDSWKWVTLQDAKRWLHESQVRLLDRILEITETDGHAGLPYLPKDS